MAVLIDPEKSSLLHAHHLHRCIAARPWPALTMIFFWDKKGGKRRRVRNEMI